MTVLGIILFLGVFFLLAALLREMKENGNSRIEMRLLLESIELLEEENETMAAAATSELNRLSLCWEEHVTEYQLLLRIQETELNKIDALLIYIEAKNDAVLKLIDLILAPAEAVNEERKAEELLKLMRADILEMTERMEAWKFEKEAELELEY